MDDINTNRTTKELFKNTGIIAIGQICTKAVNFLLLPLYTNILSKEEYGLVDVLSTYASLISVIVGLQLSASVFRYLVTCRDDAEKTKEMCSTSFFLETKLCIGYLILFLLFQLFIDFEYKWFLLLYVISLIYLQYFSGVIRGKGDNKLYALANFISALVTLVLNVLVVAVFRLGVSAMLLAYVVGPAVGVIILLLKGEIVGNIHRKCCSKASMKVLISYALPLVPNELSWTLIHSSDRMIITSFLGVAVNGIVAVSAKFSNIYTTIFSVFNASWAEQVVLHYKDRGGPEYINRMFDKMVTLFGSFAIGIIAVMPFVYHLFVPNSEYAEAYNLIPFYMIAVFFNVIIGLISSIYAVENETKLVAISTGVAAFINIVVGLIVIKLVGMYAAPISSICGYAVVSIWRLADVNIRHCRIRMKRKKAIGLFIMLLVSLISYWSSDIVWKTCALIIIMISAFVINYDMVRSAIKYLLRRIGFRS